MKVIKNILKIFLVFSLILALQTDILSAESSEIIGVKLEYQATNMYTSDLDEKIYNDIYNGLTQFKDKIDLSKYNLTTSYSLHEIYKKVICDHPEIFYQSYSSSYIGNRLYDMQPKYEYDNYTKEDIKRMTIELNNKVNQIISENIKPNMSQVGKELAIHDYIVLNTVYDESDHVKEDSYNVYGVLVNGQGVCKGYAESMNLLLNKVGIKSQMITSDEMDHAWNIVEIDGKNYHVDATWNDQAQDKKDEITYTYFNLDDETMMKSHYWNNDEYPKCTDKKYVHSPIKLPAKVDVEQLSNIDIQYIVGKDRYETAAKIADKQKYNTAILVNTDRGVSDGLSASGLSGVYNAPILLTQRDQIPDSTMKRLAYVKSIFIVGGENSISKNVENQLRSKGFSVKRLGGKDRMETSYNVANEIKRSGEFQTVILTNAYKGEADAMSISPIAVRDKSPIILTDGNTPPLVKGNTNTYIIGSTDIMSEELVKKTGATRIGGIDRFETNKIIINKFYKESKEFYIAKAYNLTDALSAAPLAVDAPIVLVDNKSDKSILKGASKITLLGGIDRNEIN